MERRRLEIGAVEADQAPQVGQSERRRELVRISRADLELSRQEGDDVVGHALFDLEPNGSREPLSPQLFLDRRQQVLGFVVVDLEIRMTGDPERP